MNSTNRVTKHRAEAAKQGRKRKEYLVSDDEHVKIKRCIAYMRGETDTLGDLGICKG